MKKNLLLVVSLFILLLLPACIVSADESFSYQITSENPVNGANSNIPVYVNETNGKEIAFNKATVTFEVGSAITSFTCNSDDTWTVTTSDPKDSGNNTKIYTCTYTAKDSKTRTGTKIAISSISYTNENGSGDTCKITGIFVTSSGDNPTTGASLPYVILFSGVALAGVAYYSTSKKTKIHKI